MMLIDVIAMKSTETWMQKHCGEFIAFD
jgi:hypothetical protein